jgi:hypothetical protein
MKLSTEARRRHYDSSPDSEPKNKNPDPARKPFVINDVFCFTRLDSRFVFFPLSSHLRRIKTLPPAGGHQSKTPLGDQLTSPHDNARHKPNQPQPYNNAKTQHPSYNTTRQNRHKDSTTSQSNTITRQQRPHHNKLPHHHRVKR